MDNFGLCLQCYSWKFDGGLRGLALHVINRSSSSNCFVLWDDESTRKPRWLVSKGRNEEALRVLQKIRTEEEAKAELKEIETALSEEVELEEASFKDLAIPWVRRVVFIGIAIAIVTQRYWSKLNHVLWN